MGRTHQYKSIILRTHDVGKADRFCILLTEERGKLAARARGVRKPKSHMGGSLLDFQEAEVSIRESRGNLNISSACCIQDYCGDLALSNFLQAAQATELLLALLEDDHPVPEVFLLIQQFLTGCMAQNRVHILPFTVRLLQELGVFPQEESHQLFCHLSGEEQEFIRACSQDQWWKLSLPPQDIDDRLSPLCKRIIAEQTNRTMRSASIAKEILDDSV